MFNKEFYPTPKHVLESMQIDCNNKVVLEPSAGKGDIVDYLKTRRAKEVVAFEINEDLKKIVSNKCQLLGSDFLNSSPEEVSHIDMIVMNPPFSNADQHIVHAFNIAPEGCEILALCNYETISKTFRYRELSRLIDSYGDYENFGNCFDTAERKTNVEVGFIKLFKPVITQENKFEGFYMDEDEEEIYTNAGLMPYNEVRALVNRYVSAVKCFDRLDSIKEELIYTTKIIGVDKLEFKLSHRESITSKEQFAKYLQKRSWSHIFSKMKLTKYVTSGVMKDINTFVEKQQQYPFTMKNVYRMLEIIVGTRQQTFNRALEEAIDNITRYTHENRFGVEGWKTNSGYMLNKKFIMNWMVEPGWKAGRLRLKYNSNSERLTDLVKVMCNVLGVNYDDTTSLNQYFNSFEGLERGKWYSWGFFEIKVFKKGTMHLKFQENEQWYRLNKAYGEIKGFTLSEKYK